MNDTFSIPYSTASLPLKIIILKYIVYKKYIDIYLKFDNIDFILLLNMFRDG